MEIIASKSAGFESSYSNIEVSIMLILENGTDMT